ncbi:uncharacterized protein LOC141906399 [Tubulanus polymorphus]|uniref:uncharacterized protein LOC141906399 n=1 Tax=Tubulanus polymorphus TaxID=672921 RepID=UPI003DA479FE
MTTAASRTLLVHRGEVVAIDVCPVERKLKGTWLKYDVEKHEWKRVCDRVVGLPSRAKQDTQYYILTTNTILESSTGLRLPTILLTEQPKNLEFSFGSAINFQVISVTSRRNFIEFGEFFAKNNSNINPLDMKYYILDGPKVLFASGHTVYLAQSDAKKTGKFVANFRKISSDVGKLKNIDYLWCASETHEKIRLLCSGQLVTDPSSHKSLLVTLTCGEKAGEFTCVTTDGNRVLQHIYAGIVSCLHVSMAQSSDRFSATVLTNKGQLLNFDNGKLVTFKNVDIFTGKCHINHLETYDESYFVIHDSKQNVGLFDVSSLQKSIVGWQPDSYEHMIIGDFLRLGSDQLLLCSTDEESDDGSIVFNKFILTDLGRFHISSQADTAAEQDSVDEGTHKAVSALQARQQVGLRSLNETEKLCQEKLSVIYKTCKNMHKMVLGEEFMEKGATLVILDSCQKIIKDKWIIILDIQNQSSGTVRSLSVSLVPNQRSEIESYCTNTEQTAMTTSYSVPDATDPNYQPSKKLKTMTETTKRSSDTVKVGEMTTVVCVSDLPSFIGSDSVNCDLLLAWTNDCTNIAHSSIAGNVCISVSDIADEKMFVDVSQKLIGRRNIEALDAVQMCVTVEVSSTFTPIQGISKISTQDMNMVYKYQEQCYVYESKPGLELSRVKIISYSKQALELCIYVWNLQQLTVMVHSLYKFLPDSVTISQKQSPDLLKNTVEAISREASLFKKLLEKNLSDQNRRHESMEVDEEVAGDIVSKTRVEFEKRRSMVNENRGVLELNSTNEMNDYLRQAQLETDSSLSLLLKQ